MVQHVYDYLTLVCKSTRRTDTVESLLQTALKTLRLSDIWIEFELVGRSRFYAQIYRFNDISIKLPSEERFFKQGICIEFSGNGMAYYQEHLKEKGLDLQHALRAWRSLSVGGIFTRPTRFDYALDEICYNSAKPLITFSKVRNCIEKHEFRSRLSAPSREKLDKNVPIGYDDLRSPHSAEYLGSTTYFGLRQSAVCCRFYDKLLEQKHNKIEVDENITSWFRVEFEFKQSRAMAVYNAFCDMSEEDFTKYMAGVINNYVSFINRDNVNISRCSLKKWWAEFLGCSGKSRLTIPPYKPTTFQKFVQWLKRQIFPSLCRYIMCIGLPAFLRQLQLAFQDLENTPVTFRHKQMFNDFKTVMAQKNSARRDCIASGDIEAAAEQFDEYVKRLCLEPWIFTSSDPENAMEKLKQEYDRYILGKGSEWQFESVQEEAEEIHLDFSYEDFPPESIFGADFNSAYCDDDDFVMEYFASGGCC